MGQAEILEVINREPERWFTADYFVDLFQQGSSLICQSLTKLYDSEFLKRRTTRKNHNLVYEYKVLNMGQEEIYAILQSEPEDWFDSEELSELTNISQTAVSRCLRRLNYDGFIIEGSEGSKKIYRFNPEKVWN